MGCAQARPVEPAAWGAPTPEPAPAPQPKPGAVYSSTVGTTPTTSTPASSGLFSSTPASSSQAATFTNKSRRPSDDAVHRSSSGTISTASSAVPFDAAPAAAPKARRVYRVGEGWEGTIPTVPHSGAARATGSGSFKRRANSSNFVISTANEVRRAGRAPAAAVPHTLSSPPPQGRDESFVRRDSGGDATARWPSMPNPGVVGLALGSQEWQTF